MRQELRSLSSFAFLALGLLLATPSWGQYTATICQTNADALIADDRNDWSHTNLPVVNEGYLHNFGPPTLPCGITSPNVTGVEITIDLLTINTSANCAGIVNYGNVLLNCPLTTTAVCPIIQDVLSVGCNNFGAGTTATGSYTLDLVGDCGEAISATDVIGVDIIPATDFSGPVPPSEMPLPTTM